MELVGPYTFVRLTTLSLAALWTLRGLWKAWVFLNYWERILHGLGYPRPWLRRVVALMLLRATVLEPTNLALLCVLGAIWGFRWSL